MTYLYHTVTYLSYLYVSLPPSLLSFFLFLSYLLSLFLLSISLPGITALWGRDPYFSCIFVSWDCHSKSLQTGWLKITVLEDRVQNRGASRSQPPPKAPGKALAFRLPASGGPGRSPAVAATRSLLHLHHVAFSVPFLRRDTCHWVWGSPG